MEHAVSTAHDSAYSPLFIQFLRMKIFAIFHYRTIVRLTQNVLYAYVELKIWCLCLRHWRCH